MEIKDLERVSENIWEIPKTYRKDMRAPVRIFASPKILAGMLGDRTLLQAMNVASLLGVEERVCVMPDGHEGYGAPVGAVFATDAHHGVISPGAIGFDINCGVRLLGSQVRYDDVKNRVPDFLTAIYREVPVGVGRGGVRSLSLKDLDRILENGVEALLSSGFATEEDVEQCESGGRMEEASAEAVSNEAKNRGRDQLGTLGAGNHFIEIQEVDEIFDKERAGEFGLFNGQLTVMIHCGSRGLGHQTASEHGEIARRVAPRYGIILPDGELAAAPFQAHEGQAYFAAMAAAANFAWANRQCITWNVRRAWSRTLDNAASGEGVHAGGRGLDLVYDVTHNIAKKETHFSGGRSKELLVHRKGATRAFPGQPVLIPGSMGTESYVLVGDERSLSYSLGSSCHGAGRAMSRAEARKKQRGAELKQELQKRGILVQAGSLSDLAEEAPFAYKDVSEVIRITHETGLALKVARLRPVGVVKG